LGDFEQTLQALGAIVKRLGYQLGSYNSVGA
jgi:hypothetical protein